MPLIVLLPFVVLGILGIAVLLHFMGKSTPLCLKDADQVRDIWFRQYPNSTVRHVHLASNNTQALLETATGLGLVWSMGTRAACRELPPACSISKTKRGLAVQIGDYAAPKLKIRLKDQQETDRWLRILEGSKT